MAKDLSGVGLTLKGTDTTFFEKMKIIQKNDTLYLEVNDVNDVNDVNEKPTFFTFTKQTDTSFVSEKTKNKFPKKIKYYLENEQLKAEVSNTDFSIEFIFERYNTKFL